MPKIAIYEFLTFYAYMYDIIGTEPPHLHVYKTKTKGKIAKIWIDSLTFAEMGDLKEKEQKLVVRLVEANQEVLLKQYNRVRQGEKVKAITLKLKK